MACGLTSGDNVFAVFNKTASQYMQNLAEIDGVYLEGLVNHGRFLAARAKDETTIKVDVNVYGNRASAATAGEVLSSSGVYLQQPASEMEHISYYNPHFLHVEELLGLGPVQETPRFEMDTQISLGDRGVESHSPATPVAEQGDGTTDISNVLSSLSHHAILSKKAGAMTLKSELKEYVGLQIQGIYIITCQRRIWLTRERSCIQLPDGSTRLYFQARIRKAAA